MRHFLTPFILLSLAACGDLAPKASTGADPSLRRGIANAADQEPS